jgi:flavodoxin
MSTEKIAKAMAETMNVKLVKVEDSQAEDLADYILYKFDQIFMMF